MSHEGSSVPLLITRPANTTAYLAGDVVGFVAATGGAILHFPNIGTRSRRTTRLIGSSLMIYSTGLISGEAQYRLRCYNAPPASALGDNDPWDLADADRASYLGKLDLGTPVDEGANLYIEAEQAKDVKLEGPDMWAYLQTIGPYTPTSGRVYVPTIHAVVL